MKNQKNRAIKIVFPIFFLAFLGFTSLKAQQAVSASGGSLSGSYGSVSQTIGQPFYATYKTSNWVLTQGVQQPFERWIITSITESKELDLVISVSPNPVSNVLVLKAGDKLPADLSYQLFDALGKVLAREKIEVKQTFIPMGAKVIGTYYLKVFMGKKEVESFKIIRN